MAKKITLNIPHASVGGLATAAWDDAQTLVASVALMTDWYTDIMFTPSRDRFAAGVVEPFIFPYNRFVVDAERLVGDPLEEIGQGIVYTDFYGKMHRAVSDDERRALYTLRGDHLTAIEEHIVANDSAGNSNILIDCHSFPSCQGDVDICIGYNTDGWQPRPEILAAILAHFEDEGYTVGINTPYSNALQPVHDPSALHNPYFSFMVELNKRIYLDEERHTLLPCAAAVRGTLCRLYSLLLTL